MISNREYVSRELVPPQRVPFEWPAAAAEATRINGDEIVVAFNLGDVAGAVPEAAVVARSREEEKRRPCGCASDLEVDAHSVAFHERHSRSLLPRVGRIKRGWCEPHGDLTPARAGSRSAPRSP